MDSNNQHVNTWSGGMNTDSSDALIQSTQYRYAENLRYVTETEENTGELHLIPGAKSLGIISDKLDTGSGVILETAQLRNIGVFLTQGTVEQDTPGWSVYTVENAEEFTTEPKCVFRTTDTSRVFGCKKISLVTKYEDEYNQKLYIADGKGPVLVVQINPKDYDGEDPNYPPIIDDISQISAYPSVTFNKPKFAGLISGQLKPGVIQYSYQFYNKYGQQSEISPATKLIPLSYQHGNSIKGYLETDSTDKGISIQIEIPNTITFERIKVFRITYHINGQLPLIESVYDEKIQPDSTITVNDVGQTALETLSLEEYNAITGIHIAPKTIESKDDYLFAGNIKDFSEEFDKSLEGYDFAASSDWQEQQLQIGQPIGGSGDIVSWKFIVTELIGDCNNSKDYINTSVTIQGDQFKVYDIEKNGQDNFEYVELQGQNIELSTGAISPSYTNPIVSSELKSLRRDEVYRYGIVLYNNMGEASSVKWIADIKTPSIDICPTFIQKPFVTTPIISGRQLITYPLGIKFTIENQNLPESVVSYEIVRCKREFSDMSILAQGVLSRPIRVSKDRGGLDINAPFTPTGMITCAEYVAKLNDSSENSYMTSKTETDCPYQFICPECVYNKDFIGVLKSNTQLSLLPVEYIYPATSFNILSGTKWWNIGNDFSNVYINSGIEISTDTDVPTLGVSYYLKTLEIQDGLTLATTDKQTIERRISNDTLERRNQYIKLYNKDTGVIKSSSVIKDVEISNGLSYNDLADTSGVLTFKDKIQAIGEYTYVNWVTQGTYNFMYNDYQEDYAYNDENYKARFAFLIGPAGACLLLDTGEDYSITIHDDEGSKAIGTFLCNIKKASVPYGGPDAQQRRQSTYKSFGDYYNKGEGETNINVFDGDTFIMPFEYCSIHKWVHPDLHYPRNACTLYSIPVETSINLAHTSGFEFSRELNNVSGDISYIQEEPSNVDNVFVQDTPQYVYNTVYSVSDSPRIFKADDDEHDEMNQDYRVYNSLLKSSNEYIDSWLKFQPANYIDVDSRLGQITGLRRFKNQLIFWQDDATGVLSVNERSLITDHDKMPLILGSGDVLSRYDYITTSNGMKVDQYADAQSESTLYWWDYVRKELCAYQQGQGYNILSKSKFVQNYINKGTNTESPKLIFDKQYNELISNVVNDESIIYNELTANFMSVYKIHPLFCIMFPDKLLLANENECDVYQWNKSIDGTAVGMNPAADGLYPKLQYVINKGADTTKVFDNGEIGGRFYGGDHKDDDTGIEQLRMQFWTPLKQHSDMTGEHITNRECNFRYAIPRHHNADAGERMRGKTMRGELSSVSNSLDFSIQYIMTKFRVSWA